MNLSSNFAAITRKQTSVRSYVADRVFSTGALLILRSQSNSVHRPGRSRSWHP
ncbi:MAG: hypothetical protein JFR38_06960 [Muribaculaceae bacterium]|nr:hypothetical protein [Muribaculaceae bacterium]